jgi:cell division protein FtsN
MKIKLLFLGLMFTALFRAQVNIKTTLPKAIELGKAVTFDVIIRKGPLKDFSKYLLEVPDGIVIKEVDSRTGTFFFEDNQARVVWPITPSETDITIKFILESGDQPGVKLLKQTYHYEEAEKKKSVSIAALRILVTDSAKGLVSVDQFSAAAVQESLLNKELEPNVKQQVDQLRKDSKEALTAGRKEKKNAEIRLTESKEALNKAEKIKDTEARNAAIEKANTDKMAAEYDLATAEKIIFLAKTLENNANEIERLNNSLSPETAGEVKQVAGGFSVPIRSVNPVREPEIKDEVSQIRNSIYVVTEDPEDVQRQVRQLRKDSKEALATGEIEKQSATNAINEAEIALSKAKAIKKAKVRTAQIKKAQEDKERAVENLDIATKIISLGESLARNADELERRNTWNPSKEKPMEVIPPVNTEILTDKIPSKSASEKDIEMLTRAFKEGVEETKVKPETTAITTENTLPSIETKYFVQIGSFEKQPKKSDFANLGDVHIKSENGLYKVQVGSFDSKEEALKKREEIAAKGVLGFVTIYQNGKRVK